MNWQSSYPRKVWSTNSFLNISVSVISINDTMVTLFPVSIGFMDKSGPYNTTSSYLPYRCFCGIQFLIAVNSTLGCPDYRDADYRDG